MWNEIKDIVVFTLIGVMFLLLQILNAKIKELNRQMDLYYKFLLKRCKHLEEDHKE